MELLQVIAKLNDNYKPNRELSFDDLRIAWERCEDAPKMIDMAGCLNVDKILFVQIACKCARLVLHLIPKGEDSPRLAIEAAEAWIETPSEENGNATAYAAYAAAHAADAAANAAYTAAYAAAYDATYAAIYSADAAYYAACADTPVDAAYDAAYHVSRIDGKKCAEIVREYIPFELLKLAIIFN